MLNNVAEDLGATSNTQYHSV